MMAEPSTKPKNKNRRHNRNNNRKPVQLIRFGRKLSAADRYEFVGGDSGVPGSASGLSGVTGLKALAGIVSEEYLAKLKSWQTLSKIYIQMRDDVTVATLLNALKIPILAAGVSVEKAPGGSEGDALAAEVRAAFE